MKIDVFQCSRVCCFVYACNLHSTCQFVKVQYVLHLYYVLFNNFIILIYVLQKL